MAYSCTLLRKQKKARTICGETSEKPWREGCRNWWCCLELDVYDPERVVSTDDTEFKGICSRSVVILAVQVRCQSNWSKFEYSISN